MFVNVPPENGLTIVRVPDASILASVLVMGLSALEWFEMNSVSASEPALSIEKPIPIWDHPAGRSIGGSEVHVASLVLTRRICPPQLTHAIPLRSTAIELT